MPKLKSLIEPNIRLNQDRNEYILESSKRIKLYKISNIIDCHFKAFDSWKIANYLTSNNPKYQHLTANQLIEQWDSIKEYRVDLRDQIGSYINDHKEPVFSESKHAIKAIKYIRENYGDELFSNVIIFSKEHKIAGTVDLIVKNNDTGKIWIFCWKTTKKLYEKKEGWGITNATGKIRNTNFNKYQLQLSSYNFILNNFYNIFIEKQFLIHLTEQSYEIIEAENFKGIAEKIVIDPYKSEKVENYEDQLSNNFQYNSSNKVRSKL